MTEQAPLKFKGKIAPWWYGVVVLLFGSALLIAWLAVTNSTTASFAASIASMTLMLLLASFSVDICIRNHVELFDTHMKIRFSIFTETVTYSEISLIEETNNPLHSLAASLDRLHIHHRRTGYIVDVLIAVKDKEGFLQEMQLRNPHIQIKRKGDRAGQLIG